MSSNVINNNTKTTQTLPKIFGYDESRVVNFVYLSSLEGIYKCNLCHNILNDPVDCVCCGHQFCNKCITTYNCPFGCKNKILKPSSLSIKNVLSKIKFKCNNIGCCQVILYAKLENHDLNCPFQKIKCPKCGETLIKKNLDDHFAKDCKNSLVKCLYCSKEFMRKEIEEHEDKCELKNKNEGIKRISMDEYNIDNNNIENNNAPFSNYYRISFRRSLVSMVNEEELNIVIGKEIDENIKYYFNNFKTNYTKIFNEIIDLKNLLKEKEVSKSKSEKININTEENKKYATNTMNNNKNELSNCMNDLKEKLILLLKNRKDNEDPNKQMFSIIYDMIQKINNYINETNDRINILADNFNKNTKNLISKKNNKLNLTNRDIESIEKNLNDYYENELKILNEKFTEKLNENNNNDSNVDFSSELNNIKNMTNELGNITINIDSIKKNLKQVLNIINEEFSDFSNLVTKNLESNTPNKICDENNVKSSPTEIKEVKIKKINTELVNTMIQNLDTNLTSLENYTQNISKEIKEKIFSELNEKLLQLNKKIEKEMNEKIDLMFSLKYCNECQKIDYFYGFIRCSICNIYNCKECVLLCINCKEFSCKNCCTCKCERQICKKCRTECPSCKIYYCDFCFKNCNICNMQICINCIQKCSICNNEICKLNCSKTCNVCLKTYCNKCSFNIKVIKCQLCQENTCENCISICKNCDLNICKNCGGECEQCEEQFCSNCLIKCINCNKTYCNKCLSPFNKCQICNNSYCHQCKSENKFIKCFNCNKIACMNCNSNCSSCKKNYCKNCALNCNTCNLMSCAKCSSECICNSKIYCDKCISKNIKDNNIFDLNTHSCLCFLNGKSESCSKKTRSYNFIDVNINTEAKFYLNYTNKKNNNNDIKICMIGICNNGDFVENCETSIKNIWVINSCNGDKFCSEGGFEELIDEEFCNKNKENYVYIMIKEWKLFFKINNAIYKYAYDLNKTDKYWFYFESNVEDSEVKMIYLRKIK